MGIFSRIADVFKANVNDALDKAEDPEKMLKQMVIEMEESVNKATLAVANSMAHEKSLLRKIEKAKSDSAEWLHKAQQAVTAGREDLARAALEKKAIQDKNISDLEPVYLTAKSTSDKLRTQLDALKHKLDEARARQGTLIARSQAAKAQKQIAQTFSGVGSDAFSKFDKFETKIETLESQAEAFEQLAGQSTSLDDEFKKLTSSSQVEQQLLELKASMGKLPSASKDALPPHQE
jgi:phage shock protein A